MKITSPVFSTIVKAVVFIESALARKAADVVANFFAGVRLPVEVAAVEPVRLQPRPELLQDGVHLGSI